MDHLKSLKIVDYHHRFQGPLDGPVKSKKETLSASNYFIFGFCFLVFTLLLLPFLNSIAVATIFFFAFIQAREKYWQLPRKKQRLTLGLGVLGIIIVCTTCYYAATNLYHSGAELNQYLNYDFIFKKIQSTATDFLNYFKSTFNELLPFLKFNNDLFLKKINEGTVKVLSLLGVKVAQLFSSLPYLFLQAAVFISTFFIWKKLRRKSFDDLTSVVPANFTIDKASIARAFKESSYTTVVSTIIVGLIQSVLITSGAIICGIKAWPLVLISAFIFSLLPLIGTFPVSLALIIYLFSNTTATFGFVFLGFALCAAIIDNIVRTLFIANSKEDLFSPVITFFSVIGGIYVLGFSGLFLAPFLIIFTQKLLNLSGSQSASLPSTLSH